MQKLFVMVGIPGSGKTEFALQLKDLYDAEHINVNEVRFEVTHNYKDKEHNDITFHESFSRMANALEEGKNVIFDATSISAKARESILEHIPEDKRDDVETIAVYMHTPTKKCLARNKARSRIVPEDVILNMKRWLEKPMRMEGFDTVLEVFN